MKLSKTNLTILIQIVLVTIIPLLMVYTPFVLHIKSVVFLDLKTSGMQQIYANWDGPNYVMNAITLHDIRSIAAHPFISRPNEYYAAHFPLYSWLIRPVGLMIGYFPGALMVNLVSNIVLNIIFYFWIREKSKHPLWLTFVFTIFPPRYWIVRSVIGPEMLLVACILGSLWSFQKGKHVLAGLIGMCAVMLKFQALVLVPTYILMAGHQAPPVGYARRVIKSSGARASQYKTMGWNKKTMGEIGHWILDFIWNLIFDIWNFAVILPLVGYLLVALFYHYQMGDFNAYFKAQSIVGMGATIPFGMFDSAAQWVGTGWLEHTALYFIGMFILVAKLGEGKHYLYFAFALLYTVMLSLIPQVDIMRLAMPLAPLFIWSFSEFFEGKVFRIALICAIPMLYLYTLNFIMTNQAPIADWGMFK